MRTPTVHHWDNSVPSWEQRYSNGFGASPGLRYPASRMGVEDVIREAFTEARAYQKEWRDYQAKLDRHEQAIPPRRDLKLEPLVEVLEGKRYVHAHCYRADEILMLLRVSDDFGFKIRTLQHVLEGYKVAKEIADTRGRPDGTPPAIPIRPARRKGPMFARRTSRPQRSGIDLESLFSSDRQPALALLPFLRCSLPHWYIGNTPALGRYLVGRDQFLIRMDRLSMRCRSPSHYQPLRRRYQPNRRNGS